MNCNFWNAFEAIGTTVGSFITAIAVVVAVIQYKQPLAKRVNINISTAIPIFDIFPKEAYYCFSVSNTGVRPIFISNVYLYTRRKKFVINNILISLGPGSSIVSFPIELKPENCFDMFVSYNQLSEAFRNLIATKNVKPNQRIKVLVIDTTSGKYYKSLLHLKAKDIANYKAQEN